MNYAMLIYWASVLDGVKGSFIGIVILCAIGFIMTGIGSLVVSFEYDSLNNAKKPMAWCRNFAIGMFAALIANSFIPSERTMYLMMGAQLVQDVARNPRVQNVGDRVIALVEHKLDQAIADTANDRDHQPAPATDTPARAN